MAVKVWNDPRWLHVVVLLPQRVSCSEHSTTPASRGGGGFSFFLPFFSFFASNPPLPHQNLTITFAGAYLHLLHLLPLLLLLTFRGYS